MWTKIKTLASLYRELGPRWTLFRLAYAFRLRTGLIRLQMPMGEWSDYKNLVDVGAGTSLPILSIPKEDPPNISWKLRDAVGEADYLVDGMPLDLAHEF